MLNPLPRAVGAVLSVLGLAVLACTVPGAQQPDTSATVQAVYLTITAQALTSPPPTATTIGTTLPALDTSPTAVLPPSATPPDARTGNGPSLIIPRCAVSMTIDAAETDWIIQPGVSRFALDSVTYGAGEWLGTADLSGYVRLCWNDDGLFVYVEVTDDVHVQNQQGETSWKGDEVELVFDSDLRGDFYNAVWNGDDIQLGLSPGNFADLPPTSVRYHPTINRPAGIELTARQLAGGRGYVLEAKISWGELAVTPQAGLNVGLCLALSDNDHIGTAQQDTMVSHCSRLRVSDPTTWVTATFAQ